MRMAYELYACAKQPIRERRAFALIPYGAVTIAPDVLPYSVPEGCLQPRPRKDRDAEISHSCNKISKFFLPFTI